MNDEQRRNLKLQRKPSLWLKLEYERLLSERGRYSLRDFAKTLNISSGRVSEFLSNRRQITLATAQQIAAKLNYDADLFESLKTCIQEYRVSRKSLMRELSQIVRSAENQEEPRLNNKANDKDEDLASLTLTVDKTQLVFVKEVLRTLRQKLSTNNSDTKSHQLEIQLKPVQSQHQEI